MRQAGRDARCVRWNLSAIGRDPSRLPAQLHAEHANDQVLDIFWPFRRHPYGRGRRQSTPAVRRDGALSPIRWDNPLPPRKAEVSGTSGIAAEFRPLRAPPTAPVARLLCGRSGRVAAQPSRPASPRTGGLDSRRFLTCRQFRLGARLAPRTPYRGRRSASWPRLPERLRRRPRRGLGSSAP